MVAAHATRYLAVAQGRDKYGYVINHLSLAQGRYKYGFVIKT